jgi:beta-barrel assembly-enhancing protease
MWRTTRALLPLLLLVSLAAGCGSSGLGGSVSLDQEWQLGDQMAAQVAQQVQLVHDQQAVAYVRMVGERIHAVTPLANRPFDFEIVNDSSVNAFSLPGGHVYVNTGLIAQAGKVDELAAVLAHEISHVVARHAIKQVEKANTINIIGSILLGQNANALEQIAAQIIAGGAMARFSRADEKQADDMGLQFMADAGYDPHGMLDMFQRLLALERTNPGAVARFFLDHPGTQDRINDIEGRINRMAVKSGIVDDPDYQVIRRRIT